MKRALILNAINFRIGGVLIRGERGTAKSTVARGLAALLPEIKVVADHPSTAIRISRQHGARAAGRVSNKARR